MNAYRREHVTAAVIKLIAILSGLYGIGIMLGSPRIMTYFTTLSNIFIIIMLMIGLAADIVIIRKGSSHDFRGTLYYAVKFAATVSILLTFTCFTFLLGPTFKGGLISAWLDFGCGSLCLHLITPVLAVIDFLLFDYRFDSRRSHAFIALLPPIAYLGYVVIAAGNGMRWDAAGRMMAPYNFLNFGAECGWFGFRFPPADPSVSLGIGVAYCVAVLLILFTLAGLAMLRLLRRRARK